MSLFSFIWRREHLLAWLRQPRVWWPLVFSTAGVVISWWLALSLNLSNNEGVVMRYSVYLGANWISDAPLFVILPLTATAIVLVNVLLGYLIGRRTLLLGSLWLWSAVAWSVGFGWLIFLLVQFNS